MPRQRPSRFLFLASWTTLALGACASSTQVELDRPNLPPLAASCVKAALPAIVRGEDLEVWALKNRKAAHQANRAVGNCQKFYEDVLREYGAQK